MSAFAHVTALICIILVIHFSICYYKSLAPKELQTTATSSLLVTNLKEASSYKTALIACACILAIAYILIFIEAHTSQSRAYIHNYRTKEEALVYIEVMKKTNPTIKWHVECFDLTNTEDSYSVVHVVRHSQSEVYQHRGCKDISSDPPIFAKGTVCRVRIFHIFSPLFWGVKRG